MEDDIRFNNGELKVLELVVRHSIVDAIDVLKSSKGKGMSALIDGLSMSGKGSHLQELMQLADKLSLLRLEDSNSNSLQYVLSRK